MDMSEAKITKTELAKQLNISRPTLNKYIANGDIELNLLKTNTKKQDLDINKRMLLIDLYAEKEKMKLIMETIEEKIKDIETLIEADNEQGTTNTTT